MHSLLLVIGDDLHRRLHAFADHTKVAPYRVYMEGERLAQMAEYYGLTVDDIDALVAKMPEWGGITAEVHDGRISYWLRDNPNGKFDFYKVGGRFEGYLRLRRPQDPSFIARMFGAKASDRTNRARKSEIVIDEVLTNPPAAILVGESWIEQPLPSDAHSDERWRQQFGERFNLLAEDELITVVDIHS